MAARRRVWRWLLRGLAVLVLAALGTYLYVVGLDQADKLASALGLLVAVAGLFLSLRASQSPRAEVEDAQKPEPLSEPPRTAYLEDVRMLAPPQLLGREAELAQLATFCTADGPSHWRWVAEAWSGKSALLAWFVLHPPERVDVVSFFISTRFDQHDNRDAFIDAVTEQLDALAGVESAPLPVSARARHLRHQLRNVAATRRRDGRRLVLVVDGLDEDSAAAVGQSIAGLLPQEAVPGLKVIVAGRPNPPLPPELAADHPLRSATNIHVLTPSGRAKDLRLAAELELRRLLGDPLGRSMLGLLTVAAGHLTAADLAQLSGAEKYEARQLLRSSTGRTFVSRPGRWRTGPEYETFGLAHEELRLETLWSLDDSELERYRQALLSWAARFEADGWPADTPEYLLRGYPGFLRDAERFELAVALASDQKRQSRMLEVTGGDQYALSEISSLVTELVFQDRPDLPALARLGFHRRHLEVRNSLLPMNLPSLWAKLGQYDRAEAMAHAFATEFGREGAVGGVVWEIAEQRDVPRLERLLSSSEDPDHRLCALAALIEAATADADWLRVDQLTDRVLEEASSASDLPALMLVVTALAESDDQRAERLQARLEGKGYFAALVLVTRAKAAGERGDHALAARLSRRAEALSDDLPDARRFIVLSELAAAPSVVADEPSREALRRKTVPEPDQDLAPAAKVAVLTEAAARYWRAGWSSIAGELTDEVLSAYRALPTGAEARTALDGLCRLLGLAGDSAQAHVLIGAARERYRTDGRGQQALLTELALGLTEAGHHSAADQVLEGWPGDAREVSWGRLAQAEAGRGSTDRARSMIARMAPGPDRLQPLAELAQALAKAGDGSAVAAVADEAIGLADAVPDVDMDNYLTPEMTVYGAMVDLAHALADTGLPDRAAELADWVETRRAGRVDHPATAELVGLADALIGIDDAVRAERVIAVIDPMAQRRLQADLVDRLLSRGDDVQAEAVADRMLSEEGRLKSLAAVVRRRGCDGSELASKVCEPLGTGGAAPYYEAQARVSAVVELGAGCGYDAAARLAETIAVDDDVDWREWAFVLLAVTAAEAGDDQAAERLADQVHRPFRRIQVLTARAESGSGADRVDLVARAVATLPELEDPEQRRQAHLSIASAFEASELRDPAMEQATAARSLAAAIADPEDRDRALLDVVKWFVGVAEFDTAAATADLVGDEYERREAFVPIAKAAAIANDLVRAEAAVNSLPTEEWRQDAWADVGTAVADSGDHRRAEELSRCIIVESDGWTGGYQRVAGVLQAAARSAWSRDDLDEAERLLIALTNQAPFGTTPFWAADVAGSWADLAGAVGDPADERARLWVGRALDLVGQIREAEVRSVTRLRCVPAVYSRLAAGLIGQAFADGPWHLPLAAWGGIEPEGLQEFADEVLMTRHRG
ncbi:hypothetical protein FB561_1176 [Kribbella amoyensis]|uniref:NACHT domain-containing protein n=1 Tax=Kribbella amoyensis TaxID=996641 RepID=A0A561BMM8_9ACTN|nr:hypothetical protein [Kribbella amoyensis]TWD80104.1 hypothetical protein FB561_1176 [Kribbella amoyensis]